LRRQADWAAQRIKGLDLHSAVLDGVQRSLGRSGQGKATAKTLIEWVRNQFGERLFSIFFGGHRFFSKSKQIIDLWNEIHPGRNAGGTAPHEEVT